MFLGEEIPSAKVGRWHRFGLLKEPAVKEEAYITEGQRGRGVGSTQRWETTGTFDQRSDMTYLLV